MAWLLLTVLLNYITNQRGYWRIQGYFLQKIIVNVIS